MGQRRSFAWPRSAASGHFRGLLLLGIGDQKAAQENAQAQAQEDAEEDQMAAPGHLTSA
jgi:hypothetical protein